MNSVARQCFVAVVIKKLNRGQSFGLALSSFSFLGGSAAVFDALYFIVLPQRTFKEFGCVVRRIAMFFARYVLNCFLTSLLGQSG